MRRRRAGGGFRSTPLQQADANSHPDTFNAAIGTATHEEAKWNYSLYVQDTWQVRDSLTLNLGLRYDVDNTITVGNGLVDARNARYLANLGVAPLVEVKKDLNNVAPGWASCGCPPTIASSPSAAARGSSSTRITSTTTTSTSIRRCWPIGGSTSTATARRTTRSTTPRKDWPSRVRCRAFLAERFPLFPNVASLGLIPELAVALAPDFRVRRTRQAALGFTTASRALLRPGRLRLLVRRRCGAAADLNLDFVNGQWVTKDPRFTGINVNENLGYIRYNALQTRTDYRGTRLRTGLRIHAIESDIQQQRQRRRVAATNPLDLSVDDGPTNEDRRHNLVGQLVYVPARVPARRHLSLRQRLAL